MFLAASAITTLSASTPKAATSGPRSAAQPASVPNTVPRQPSANAGISRPARLAMAPRLAPKRRSGVARRTARPCAALTGADAGGSTPVPAATKVRPIAQMGPVASLPSLVETPRR